MPPAPFRSELLQLAAPNNMIDEIWNVVFKYAAPNLEVCDFKCSCLYDSRPLLMIKTTWSINDTSAYELKYINISTHSHISNSL